MAEERLREALGFQNVLEKRMTKRYRLRMTRWAEFQDAPPSVKAGRSILVAIYCNATELLHAFWRCAPVSTYSHRFQSLRKNLVGCPCTSSSASYPRQSIGDMK